MSQIDEYAGSPELRGVETDASGECGTNGASFRWPNSPIGEGKKLRRSGDRY
jgi:hypothetical protein